MTIGEFVDIDLFVHAMDKTGRLFLSAGRPDFAPVEVDIHDLVEHELARRVWNIGASDFESFGDAVRPGAS